MLTRHQREAQRHDHHEREAPKHQRKKRNMAARPCGASTRLQKIYYDMKHRCYNPNNKAYSRYGHKGIRVYDEWINSRKAFYEWALSNGYKEDLSIDRIDNSKGYFPENCRFVTPKVQTRNRTISVVNEEIVKQLRAEPKGSCLKYLCAKYGLKRSTLIYIRYNCSWRD